MILIDSSGWVEFFAEGPLAGQYAKFLRDLPEVVTPTIVMYEVFKRIKRDLGEDAGLIAVAAMQKTQVVPLDQTLALSAAELSLTHRLAMADAIVLATARSQHAVLVTSDDDFAGIDGVTLLSKKKLP